MFAKKELRIFDTDVIKTGNFITYCSVSEEWEWGEEDKDEHPVYYDNPSFNGMITKVQEEKLYVINEKGGTVIIGIEEVVQDSDDRKGIKILGIRENAI